MYNRNFLSRKNYYSNNNNFEDRLMLVSIIYGSSYSNVTKCMYNTFIVWQKLQLKVTFFCILWITSQNNYLRCVWFYCLTLLAIYRENRSNIWSLFVIKLVIKLLNRDSVILPIHRSATMSNFSFSIKSAPLLPNSIQRDSKNYSRNIDR